MPEHPGERAAGPGLKRYVLTMLGIGLEGSSVYYVIVGGYMLLVAAGVWLLSRPGWLTALGGLFVLLDGMALMLMLLQRWLNRRIPGRPPTG
ncbi:MAG: hypothetical protein E6J45_03795 [Chloroflexi bacterium]|nr:MAG: hypothetical protein E6J45_03795 [Chloroflexota bacterium]